MAQMSSVADEGGHDALVRVREWTYEDIVDVIIERFRRADVLPPATGTTPWNAFVRLSNLIHGTYEIPDTTVTPVMRRLLFGLAVAARSVNIVGVGTYVGYPFSWLLRDRADRESVGERQWETATGIDVDEGANIVARRNCSVLGHDERLRFLTVDGVVGVSRSTPAIDLLFIDLDDQVRRKAAYRDVLEAALPQLQVGALVLAHDPCVPAFEKDFAAYHGLIRESGLFRGPWVLRVDGCGLSVAAAR